MKSNALRNAISIALFAAVSSTAAVAGANDTSPVTSGGEQSPPSADTALHLPAGPLSAALDALARQAGLHLQWSSSLVAGRQVPAVNGALHWRAALDQLLQGTGLAYRQDDSGSIVISPIASNAAETGASVASKDRQATALETLTVTGTRIRGGSTPSPVVTINNKRMQEEGFRDLGEVVRSIPQNFSGGQNPGVARGATQGAGGPANANLTGASSLNLRGLGPDATLTLLNGRRMSYGGYIQAVDIGAIPIEAVERIEIVPDGASAIYGSDAVGGVANVILKRDMDGVSVGARYAHATDGGMTTRDYSVTAGTTWSSGGVIVAYKDVSVDSVRADQRRYTRAMLSPTTIYPASHLKSALVSLHQSLGEVAELRVDALKTRRSQDYAYYYASTAASYNHLVPKNAALVVSPSIDFFLPGDWTLSLGGTRGDDNLDNLNLGVTVATGVYTPRIHECTCNKLSSYEASAEGPLFALPAGDIRLAVGTGYRRNEFRYLNHLTGVSVIDTKEGSRFSYAEAAIPLMGNGDDGQARHRLELTAAVRNEDYDSFGSVTTPKLGLIYTPGTDFTVKASWGRSFKAPTLYQMHAPRLAQLVTVASLGATSPNPSATAMLLGGGNPDLSAERAVTRTASLAFHPEAVPGLEAELTWFQVGYRGRVVQPISNWTRPLVDPTYAQFIQRSPSPAVLSELLASVQNFFNTSGLPYNPANVEAVLRSGYTNVAEQKIDGLDLSGTYTVPVAVGQLTLRGAVSWLNSTQKTSPLAPEFDVAGTLFSPARVNGRLGAVWNRDALSFSVFGNYRSGVLDTGAGRKTSSFTTFDANVHYAPKLQTGVLSGMELSVGVQNLFNREPPLHMPASRDQAPYDSTNYSALGRILSASVSWNF